MQNLAFAAVYDYADISMPMPTKMFGRRLRGHKVIGYNVPDNIRIGR